MPVQMVIGTRLPEIKPSKNRSKRIWKKLLRKGATPLYGPVRIISMSAAVSAKLEAIAASRQTHSCIGIE